MEQTVDDLLADLHGANELDLMRDVAAPLPIAVIGQLLGIPVEDRVDFTRIGYVVGQSLDGVTSLREADALRAAVGTLATLFERLADERRGGDGDDVITMLTAPRDDERITGPELVATCRLLLIAGVETTVNLLGNATAHLLADRTEWERLVADPNRAELVVEETLRHDPPVQFTVRVAHEDVELAGARITRGTVVLVDLATANRDPEVFADPDHFRPDRYRSDDRAGEHLAFSSGIHYCLGAPLARLEGVVALKAPARQRPDLAARTGARRRAGTTIRGWASLPVADRGGTQ